LKPFQFRYYDKKNLVGVAAVSKLFVGVNREVNNGLNAVSAILFFRETMLLSKMKIALSGLENGQ